mgnify:CR=1 FL=1
MGGSTSRSARDPSRRVTRRTIVSPAGGGTTESLALACASGASPRPTLSREHVHAPGPVVAERTWSGGTQTAPYRHRDHLGSLRIAPDAEATLADAHDYDPFGGETGAAGSEIWKKLTGHERNDLPPDRQQEPARALRRTDVELQGVEGGQLGARRSRG